MFWNLVLLSVPNDKSPESRKTNPYFLKSEYFSRFPRSPTIFLRVICRKALPHDIRVILNGQFGCGGGGAGAGRGAVDAWWRRGGHKGHDSLKLEKDGKCASGATKIDR
jgi:hypothetical protein